LRPSFLPAFLNPHLADSLDTSMRSVTESFRKPTCLHQSFSDPFYHRLSLSRFEIVRGEILDQRPVSHSPQLIEILHKHVGTDAMPGKCNVQIFTIGHR
jgi:hypothetical protein